MNSQNKTRAKNAWARSRKLLSNERGAELLEFAFALPILVVMLAGVFDFGEAWALKEKLDGAARDGARVAVASFNDMNNPQCGGNPCSVQAAVNAVLGTLTVTSPGFDACGVTAASITGAPYTWSDSGTCTNGGTFTITVSPAVDVVDTTTAPNMNVLSTQVTVTYPYTVSFFSVFGSTFTLTSTVTMANLN